MVNNTPSPYLLTYDWEEVPGGWISEGDGGDGDDGDSGDGQQVLPAWVGRYADR